MSPERATDLSGRIPDRLYFKIGEVSKITRVKPYVLRYWESEFKAITPMKTGGNQRVYKRRDVELIFYIKKLLHDERFTLEGAKKKVVEFKKERDRQLSLKFEDKEYVTALKGIRKDLAGIKELLGK